MGPSTSTRAQTIEPEYVGVSADDTKAWVGLQEQDAIAVLDLATNAIEQILSLGVADAMDPRHAFDASDQDGAVNIVRWPVYLMYQPDDIVSYQVDDATYYLTANEGELRDDAWSWYEDKRVAKLKLDPEAFPDAELWQNSAMLGRLKVTTLDGDEDGDGEFEDLYAPGARSFAIWNSTGELVWDSGNEFETITAARYGIDFSNDNAAADPDGRSDAKGPEPEALVLGAVADQTYAFIALERMGGIFTYDVSDPEQPEFVGYLNNRDVSVDPSDESGPDAGDLGPETLVFVSAADSPVAGMALLIAANEVGGTVTVYSVAPAP